MTVSYTLLAHGVCAYFDSIKDSCRGKSEIGGILIGSYRGPHLEITSQTEPGPGDTSTRTSFVRCDRRHQRAATDAWHRSKQTQTYVGEWHSHPLGSPKPSHIDENAWSEVVQKLMMPCVFVIVSSSGWSPFKTYRDGRAPITKAMKVIERGETGTVFE